ncbi:CCA tRNA nucleotidyltransferase [Bacillus salacetis]|uniref:CCA-adding enzyme n=1 Tax=Bacillus salacetis TaxID=2315464 RepID=A0A3A1QWT8_9BACI|nr:CCA tRNA nucleotidyltransferase [Bacillus salacetis]RIW33127.1 CCA tRNA nucleotidyltransferase [Bacillus salacetis]
MLPALFKQALPVLKKLEEAGYQCYFVGGAVRDLLLGRRTNDIDIATSALPEEVKAVFSKTIDVGIEHGTVVVLHKGTPYEITTFRSEKEYKDYRRPESVTFITSLKEDLQRRDFTINAIAMDSSGRVHDPFCGESDIKAKVIRTVGSAEERFKEDALRMMRAVRFMSQLGFEMEKDTFESIKQNGSKITHVSIERLSAEFEKLLHGRYKKTSIASLRETGLYQYLPGLKNEVLKSLEELSVNQLTNEQMWMLLCYLSDECESLIRNWRLPVKKIKYISKAVTFMGDRMKKEWDCQSLYAAGLSMALDVEEACRAINQIHTIQEDDLKRKYELLPIKNRSQLAITGNDILKWTGKTGGPWIKEILEKTEKAVIRGEIPNQKSTIREWLGLCNHQ